MNTTAIVICSTVTNGRPDKNGLDPMMLTPLAGKAPNRNVISGTTAQMLGFQLGKRYFVTFNETEANEYGRQFRITNGGEVSVIDAVQSVKELGQPVLVNVLEEVPATKIAEFA